MWKRRGVWELGGLGEGVLLRGRDLHRESACMYVYLIVCGCIRTRESQTFSKEKTLFLTPYHTRIHTKIQKSTRFLSLQTRLQTPPPPRGLFPWESVRVRGVMSKWDNHAPHG